MAQMKLKQSCLYKQDIESVLNIKLDFINLRGKCILITGATGLIGSVLVDKFVFISEKFNLALKLWLVSRNVESHSENKRNVSLNYIKCDISNENVAEKLPQGQKIDFVFHLASTTHPVAYSKYPVETILTNVNGTEKLLELVSENSSCRFILASTVEVYGDDIDLLENGFSETDFGYLDCNTSRACYNEAKRLSETLCQSYRAEKNCDVVIARLARSYGPTLRNDDTKALSQFLSNGVKGENIILKSNGTQFYSYIYNADAANALLFLMFNGENGTAYNVGGGIESNIYLKDLAKLVAKNCGVKVIFDIPDETEQKGYSKAIRAVLNPKKINLLGWKAQIGIEEGIRRTIKVMRGDDEK